MSDKKYVVPEEGFKVAWCGYVSEVMHKGPNYGEDTIPLDPAGREARKEGIRVALEAFIRWQDGELGKMIDCIPALGGGTPERWWGMAVEAVRLMYLAPESEVPKSVKDLMFSPELDDSLLTSRRYTNNRILEAYRRGKESR